MTFVPYESLRTMEPFCNEMDNKALRSKVTSEKGISEIPSIEAKYGLDIKKAMSVNVT
ncbi:MAG: hypothetical protein PHZ11_02675 [Desulfitobacteriaceae bacterium]|nr:hypothetical protein [Desulfitobacteriaceae bacterium]MDD4345798.1 hypothetical protein [Desulfitobacteriaceae bacterium]MDD4402260.1 hypothetical protein [Desulfitobacteriaceae bacterium]